MAHGEHCAGGQGWVPGYERHSHYPIAPSNTSASRRSRRISRLHRQDGSSLRTQSMGTPEFTYIYYRVGLGRMARCGHAHSARFTPVMAELRPAPEISRSSGGRTGGLADAVPYVPPGKTDTKAQPGAGSTCYVRIVLIYVITRLRIDSPSCSCIHAPITHGSSVSG